uniref:MADS-box domain-containing protein n=1 Tax=Leersia perrieri TaxID=77586 RepID=A0A0D9WQL6_9ORYZ
MTKRKIEIKRIKNVGARQVCFSKRRPSVFKKASELYTLCGAEVAMLVKSPAGNIFSFGAPSVRSVLCRSRHTSVGEYSSMAIAMQNGDSATITLHELTQQHIELENQLKDQNEKMRSLQQAIKQEAEGKVMCWLDGKVEDLCKDDLEEFNMVLLSLNDMIKGMTNQLFHNYTMFSHMMYMQHCVTTVPNQQFLLNSEDVKPIIHHVPSSSNGWNIGMDGNPN